MVWVCTEGGPSRIGDGGGLNKKVPRSKGARNQVFP